MTLTCVKGLFYNNSLLITVHMKVSRRLENILFLFYVTAFTFKDIVISMLWLGNFFI